MTGMGLGGLFSVSPWLLGIEVRVIGGTLKADTVAKSVTQ